MDHIYSPVPTSKLPLASFLTTSMYDVKLVFRKLSTRIYSLLSTGILQNFILNECFLISYSTLQHLLNFSFYLNFYNYLFFFLGKYFLWPMDIFFIPGGQGFFQIVIRVLLSFLLIFIQILSWLERVIMLWGWMKKFTGKWEREELL
jgi:hypothetical protein